MWSTGGGGIDAFQIGASGTLTRLAIAGFDSGTTTMLAVKAVPTFEVLMATDGGSTNNLRTFNINTGYRRAYAHCYHNAGIVAAESQRHCV